jgi:hypothetical protein
VEIIILCIEEENIATRGTGVATAPIGQLPTTTSGIANLLPASFVMNVNPKQKKEIAENR